MSYYIQLTQEERYHISVLCKEGFSKTETAKKINRRISTNSRELNRNTGNKMVYNGILITVELAKSANDWLTNNCFGEPSARDKPQEKEPEPGR